MVLDAKVDRFESSNETRPDSYTLTINQEALDKITETGDPTSDRLEKSINKFIDIWSNQNILEFSLAVHNGAIDYVGVISSDGEQSSIPLSVFVKVFDGIEYFRKNDNSDPIGFKFDGGKEYIIPKTNEEMAKSIISKIRILDTSPNKDFSVYKGQFKESPMVL